MANTRTINESSFGGQLQALRKEARIQFDGMRIALDVTKTYLNDIETDFTRPPTPRLQLQIARLLHQSGRINSIQLENLFDLAAEVRHEVPADVFSYLRNNPGAVKALRDTEGFAKYRDKNIYTLDKPNK